MHPIILGKVPQFPLGSLPSSLSRAAWGLPSYSRYAGKMCPRPPSCSAIVTTSDKGFVEHLKSTSCPECFELPRHILYQEAKAAVNRNLESLKVRPLPVSQIETVIAFCFRSIKFYLFSSVSLPHIAHRNHG
jgi:hypothetical protein